MSLGIGRADISIDISDALTTVHQLRDNLTPENFNLCLEYTIKDTGNRAVKKYIKEEIPQEYAVTAGWVGSKVQGAKFTGGGAQFGCVVPVSGERGTIGGIFAASGGGVAKGRAKKNGMALKKLKNRRSDIQAQILKGKMSSLPGVLPNQGGNPPFRMNAGVVMTRTTNKRKPIARVVGRAVPQMVDKHFESRIEPRINKYIVERFNQNAKRFLKV